MLNYIIDLVYVVIKMFKRSNSTPPAKQSSFTSSQILSDINTVMKQDGKEISSPFYENLNEDWYDELKGLTNITDELIDSIEHGAELKDELVKLKKDIQKDSELIRQKAQEALERK